MENKNSCKIHRCALKKSKNSLKYYATIVVFYAKNTFSRERKHSSYFSKG